MIGPTVNKLIFFRNMGNGFSKRKEERGRKQRSAAERLVDSRKLGKQRLPKSMIWFRWPYFVLSSPRWFSKWKNPTAKKIAVGGRSAGSRSKRSGSTQKYGQYSGWNSGSVQSQFRPWIKQNCSTEIETKRTFGFWWSQRSREFKIL